MNPSSPLWWRCGTSCFARGESTIPLLPEFSWQGRIARLRNGLPIEVDDRDMVGREILRQGCWEWGTFRFLEEWLRPGMTAIDAGAHIGQYVMLASTRLGARGHVHCFEPHPGLYRVLRRNL